MIFLPYYVFTSRNQRDKFCGDSTTQKREQSDNGYCQPYRQLRMGNIAADDPFGNKREEEDVHQIHAKGEFSQTVNPAGSLLNASE